MLGLLAKDDVFSCVAKPEGVPMLLGQHPEAPDGMMLYEDY